MKKLLVFAIAVMALGIAIGLASSSTASAGEITGNGKDTPIRSYKAASICSFSGLNDEYQAGESDFRTQSPGDHEGSGPAKGFTGIACNPTSGFEE
jgi:hypothetical protein